MFDFSNLNDWEFEVLCKDIVKRLYNVDLRCFRQGKDGGRDAADSKTLNSSIMQAKKYTTNFSVLFSALKKEKEKIDKIKPKQYFVCTSLRLSPDDIFQIYNLFSEYMANCNNILDGTQISDFLEEPKNKDLIEKNYKLWMVASNVLSNINSKDIIIDGEVLLHDINKKKNFYVKTDYFHSALEKLRENKTILIIGDPGVGKSTISNMLTLFLVGLDFRITYSSGNSIDGLKKALLLNPDKKELVYIDDFLGQSYLELKSRSVNELHSLVAFIKMQKNKYLILNSRITIHKEAETKFNAYGTLLENVNVSILDINKMSLLDKAKIFYDHLYFNDVEPECLSAIRKERNYMKILNHPNYNPRIIEYVTKKGNFNKNDYSDYCNYIIESLNFPEKVWENEFKYRLDVADRIFMNSLFSLTNNAVSIEVFIEVFNKRLTAESIDTSKDIFDDVYKRLSENLVKITVNNKNERNISVANPSINDYIRKSLSKNKAEIEKILGSVIYIEQFETLVKEFFKSSEMKELVKSKRLFDLKHINYSVGYYYIKYLEVNNINILEEKELLLWALMNFTIPLNNLTEISNLLTILLSKKFIIENDLLLDISGKNIMTNILCHLTINDCKDFAYMMLDLLKNHNDEKIRFKQLLSDCLEILYKDYFLDKLYDMENDILDEAIEKTNDFDCIVSYADKILVQKFDDLICDTFPCYIHPDYSFEPEMFGDDILCNINFEELLNSIDKDDYFADERRESRYESEQSVIDDIFDR